MPVYLFGELFFVFDFQDTCTRSIVASLVGYVQWSQEWNFNAKR